MAIPDINPVRTYVTSGADRYYAVDPLPVAGYLARVYQPAPFLGKANGYRVTSDGQAGTGYILLKRQQLDAMDRGLSTFAITFETNGISAPSGTVTISNLHITNAVAVTGTIIEKPDDIYLVEFKDNIDYAQLTSLNKGYNLRTPDWVSSTSLLSASQNGGVNWTWATMLANIWTNISPVVGGLTSVLATFPPSNPDNFADFGTNAWHAALHLCRSTHNRLICSRSGALHAISEGAADPTNTAHMALALTNKILLNPSHPKTHTKTSVPETINVFFPKRNTAFQNNADPNVVTGTEQWQSDPTYVKAVTSTAIIPALAATGVIPGTVYPLYDSMVAVYNELGVLQNGAALTTQAEARSLAYLNSLNEYEDARNDLYNGAVPFEIGPNFTCIHWYDFGNGIRTQTFSSPKKTTDGVGSGISWPGMPDLSRYHLPLERFAVGEVYNAAIEPGGSGVVRVQFGTRTSPTVTTWADTGLPHEITAHDIFNNTYAIGDRVFCVFHRQSSRWIIANGNSGDSEIVEVYHSSAMNGEIVEPTASGYHPGRIRTPNGTATYTVGAEVWLQFADGYDGHPDSDGDILAVQGENYFAKDTGLTWTEGGDARPLYVAISDERSFIGVSGSPIINGAIGTIGLLHSSTFDPAGINKSGRALHDIPPNSLVKIARHAGVWMIELLAETLVHFELVGNLTLAAEHARAKVLAWSGTAWIDSGIEIEVYDWFPGMWNGLATFRGWAKYRPTVDAVSGRPVYEIIWMERIAQTIQFTSTEYMGYTTAARMQTTVNWYDHQGKDPGATVIVRDPQVQFPDVHSGAKGTAVYDYHNGYYRVVSCQRVALFARAILSSNQCGGALAITSFSVSASGDYVGTPPTAPTSAGNDQGHAGLSSDPVALRRTNNGMPQPTWEVIDMAKHVIEPITEVRLHTGGLLQYRTQTWYAERCTTDNNAWTTWHTATECP